MAFNKRAESPANWHQPGSFNQALSDPKKGRYALTNQRSPGYPLGTDLSIYVQRNVTCSSKQQLQDVFDFKVKLVFVSPHGILNKHRHIFRQLKSNLKCFSIDESHCIERWSSEQRSFVVARFFASTCTFHGPCPAFLGFNGPMMIQSFPLLR